MAATATSSPSEPSEALVEQLSFYFTDANLRRDRFMKTFTGADGTGKMPVETLATFNRVKALTQDVGMIVAALRLIPGLQVSDPSDQEGHTVQRTRTLPAKDDSEVGSHLSHLLLSMVARLPTRYCSDGAPASLPCHASGAHGVRRAAAARREPRVDQAALLRLRRLGLRLGLGLGLELGLGLGLDPSPNPYPYPNPYQRSATSACRACCRRAR